MADLVSLGSPQVATRCPQAPECVGTMSFARVATIQAIIHSILFTITYFWSGSYSAYSAEAAKAYYWWGIIATIALALGICFAALPLRIWKYKSFLLAHIGLAILALIGCWYHIIKRYSNNWGYEVYLYISFAFWVFDRFARLVRLGAYNWPRPSPRPYAELLPGADCIKLTIFPSMGWKFQPGQYSFIYFPSIGKFYESHPFSIISWSFGGKSTLRVNEPQALLRTTDLENLSGVPTTLNHAQLTPSITFLIRPSSGITSNLCKYVHSVSASSPPSSIRGPIPIDALIEGPYGQCNPVHNASLIVCIAGGVGITAILGYVSAFIEAQRIAREETIEENIPARMVVSWSAKENGLISAVRNIIPTDAEAMGVDLRFICTQRGPGDVSNKRMDIGQILREEAKRVRKKLAVVSCGPGGMADIVRMEVVKLLQKGHNVELFEEAFAW